MFATYFETCFAACLATRIGIGRRQRRLKPILRYFASGICPRHLRKMLTVRTPSNRNYHQSLSIIARNPE
jgi:hypothetical protein